MAYKRFLANPRYGAAGGAKIYKTGQKSTINKLRRKYNSKNVVHRTIANIGKGFPKKMVMTHKYVETIGIASTSGVMNTHLFRCNGLFDPSYTGTGHQPMYYDQMAALYDHYVVIGSKMKVKLTPSATTSAPSFITAYVNDDFTVTPTSIQNIAEQSQGKFVKFCPAGNNNVTNFTLKWSAKKYFGKGVMANNSLTSAVGADPTEQSTYVVAVQADGAATINFAVAVEIDYIVIWYELKDLASS